MPTGLRLRLTPGCYPGWQPVGDNVKQPESFHTPASQLDLIEQAALPSPSQDPQSLLRSLILVPDRGLMRLTFCRSEPNIGFRD